MRWKKVIEFAGQQAELECPEKQIAEKRSYLFRGIVRHFWRRASQSANRDGAGRVHEYKDPLKMMKTKLKENNSDILKCPREIDVLVIGGGGVGSSVAYWLKQTNPRGLSVAVIERDNTYSKASTTLSAGGLRQQFSQVENIRMSMFTAEFLRRYKEYLNIEGEDPPDIQFHPGGYLFMAGEDSADELRKNHDLHLSENAKVRLFSSTELKSRYPWLNTDGIEVASYGTQNEGWFDGWSLLQGLRKKAASLGAFYIKGEAVDFEMEDRYYDFGGKQHIIKSPRHALVKLSNGHTQSVKFAVCVICAGAWAGDVARMAGIGQSDSIVPELTIPLPVEPRKRYMYAAHCPGGPGLEMPFVFDEESRVCVRREGAGNMYLSCRSPAACEEPSTHNLDVDYEYYEDHIWPALAHRIPAMGNQKLKHAWAGYYEYNYVDQNLVIGFHPFHSQIVFANGSSGHGLQHVVPIGRAVMELILHGQYKTIDLSRFEFKRFLHGQHSDIKETKVY